MTGPNEEKKIFENLRIANRKIKGKDRSTYLLPFQPIPASDGRFLLGRDEDGNQCLNILFLGLTGSGRLSCFVPFGIKIRICQKYPCPCLNFREINVGRCDGELWSGSRISGSRSISGEEGWTHGEDHLTHSIHKRQEKTSPACHLHRFPGLPKGNGWG